MTYVPLGLNPFAACVYVLSNRQRDRVKVLGWDRNGFWLLLKRMPTQRASEIAQLLPHRWAPLV